MKEKYDEVIAKEAEEVKTEETKGEVPEKTKNVSSKQEKLLSRVKIEEEETKGEPVSTQASNEQAPSMQS